MELANKNDKVNSLNKNKRLMDDSRHIFVCDWTNAYIRNLC